MNKRILIIIQIILVLATLAGSVYVSIAPANSLLQWYNVDDAFFYYRVARNVLSGHGFTFDQINLTNGFHPLWMMICLGVFWLAKYDLLLPLRVLVLISGLFNAATSLLLFRFLKRQIRSAAALAGAFFWGLYPPIFGVTAVLGMETAVSIFFIVLLLSLASKVLNESDENGISKRSLIWLGVIGAFTILARLDNLFVVGIIGVFLLFRIKKIPAMVIFDILAVSISVFIAWIIRLGSEGLVLNTYTVYPMLMVSVLMKPVILYFAGCYLSTKPVSRIMVLLRIILASAAAFVFEYLLLAVLYKLNVTKMFSNSIVALDAAIGFALVLIVHMVLLKSVQINPHNPFTTLGLWVKSHWKSVLQDGLAFGTPIAFFVGIYMVFNKLTFGTFSPISGQIKHWWSTMINTVYGRPNTLLSVLGLSTTGSNGPWSLVTSKLMLIAEGIGRKFSGVNPEIIFGALIVIVLVLFLLLMMAEHGKLARKFFNMLLPALIIGGVIHITYYTATGYTHTRGWYWIAEMLSLVIIGSLTLEGIFSWFDKTILQKFLPPVLGGLIAVALVIGHFQFVKILAPYSIPQEYQDAYLGEVEEVEFYTEPGSKIGMTGGGLVSYFIKDRTIINLDGLINSAEYFNAMQEGTATQFLDAIPLDYVFGKPYMLLESDPYDAIFKDRLVEVGFIRGYENFTLFKYVIR